MSNSTFDPVPAGDRRPLYLLPTDRAEVELEGPALRVQVAGRAPRLYPLRRLSRILLGERVHISTEALLACAGAGIVQVFLDDEGTVRARVLGAPGERVEVRQRLLDLLANPDWHDLYGQWRYATERRIVTEVREGLGIPRGAGGKATVQAWIRRRGEEWSDPKTERASRNWLMGLTNAWMANHAHQLGLGAGSELLLDGQPDIPGDLARLLAWYLEPLRLGWLRRGYEWQRRAGRPRRPVQRRDMVRLFESHGGRIGRHGRDLTNRLHQWLIELA